MHRIAPLLVLVLACGHQEGDGYSPEIENARGELRRLQETGELPLNQCRDRLARGLQRVGRGTAVEKLSTTGPAICLTDGTFVDCADVSPKLVDACGRFPIDAVHDPQNSAERKRFIAELDAAKQQLVQAAERASTATESMVYRERCTYRNDSGIEYVDYKTKATNAFVTSYCTAEISVLDANRAPTETVSASATAKPTYKAELEKSTREIDRANDDARTKAIGEVRAAVLAKLP